MESRLCVFVVEDPPPPLADPPGWLPPQSCTGRCGQPYGVMSVLVWRDPHPGWLPPLRDGWLGRSAFALTKRTCSTESSCCRHRRCCHCFLCKTDMRRPFCEKFDCGGSKLQFYGAKSLTCCQLLSALFWELKHVREVTEPKPRSQTRRTSIFGKRAAS